MRRLERNIVEAAMAWVAEKHGQDPIAPYEQAIEMAVLEYWKANSSHLVGFKGPCNCKECQSNAQ